MMVGDQPMIKATNCMRLSRYVRTVRCLVGLVVLCPMILLLAPYNLLLLGPEPGSVQLSDHQDLLLSLHHNNVAAAAVNQSSSGRNDMPHPTGMVFYVPGIGRLGNKLFQYASLYGITRRLNRVPLILDEDDLLKVFVGISAKTSKKYDKTTTIWEEQSMAFTPKLMQLPPLPQLSICCYLQSWKYFEGYEKELRNQFVFRKSSQDTVNAIFKQCKDAFDKYGRRKKETTESQHKKPSNVTFVGIHVRRRDMSSQSLTRRGFTTAPAAYIKRAMGYYQKQFGNVIFVMCSDDHYWCRGIFEDELRQQKLFLVSGGSQYEDLAILASCNHTIMTVGSYGWWAGWLAGGQVVYYSKWPIPGTEIASHINHQDYFPPHWTPME